MDKETKDNTNIPVTALISLIATGTIGIAVSATLFVSLFIYYHKCYKVKSQSIQYGSGIKGIKFETTREKTSFGRQTVRLYEKNL